MSLYNWRDLFISLGTSMSCLEAVLSVHSGLLSVRDLLTHQWNWQEFLIFLYNTDNFFGFFDLYFCLGENIDAMSNAAINHETEGLFLSNISLCSRCSSKSLEGSR